MFCVFVILCPWNDPTRMGALWSFSSMHWLRTKRNHVATGRLEGEKGNSRAISKEYPQNKYIQNMYYFEDRGGHVSWNWSNFYCGEYRLLSHYIGIVDDDKFWKQCWCFIMISYKRMGFFLYSYIKER